VAGIFIYAPIMPGICGPNGNCLAG